MRSLAIGAAGLLTTPAEVLMGTNVFADAVAALITAERRLRRRLGSSEPKRVRRKTPRISDPHWHDSGDGPILVLVNGWGASGLTWPDAWLNRLERQFRVIRPDNRGTGMAERAPTPFTMRDLAADVVAVLDAADIDRAVVVGLSMGGMIAQELALSAPERVSALVLVSTRPPVPAHRPTLGSATVLELLRPPRRGEALEAYLRRLWTVTAAPGFAERQPEVIDELVQQTVAQLTPRTLLFQQMRAVFGWGHSERLARLDVPTTIVHGCDDPLIEVGNAKTLAHLIPGSRFIELPGVGHLVPYEAAEQLEEIVLRAARPGHLAEVC
jgi:3-oxoadipate enol-lactonase